MGNDRHVTDVGGLVHEGTDLAKLSAVLIDHIDRGRLGMSVPLRR